MKKLLLACLACIFTIAVTAQVSPEQMAVKNQAEKIAPADAVGDPVDMDAALIAGADYLQHAQADVTEDNAGNGDPDIPDDPDDGGWDWKLTDPAFTHSITPSPTNIYGATGMGLYYAWLETGDAGYFTALQDAADVMAVNPDIRSASDLVFLMRFQDLAGVTPNTYQDAAKTKFDARITNYGSATAFAEYIRDVRALTHGYENGIIPWDIGHWALAAKMLDDRYSGGAYDYAQAADDIAEVIYQDSYMQNPGYFDLTTNKNNGWDSTYATKEYWWYTLGITGIIEAFVSANVHTTELPGLMTILLDCQYASGAFSYCYGANPDDEGWQSTAYSVMAMALYDQAAYQDEINWAAYWTGATQQETSGGWVYTSGNHYPEIGGENTCALYFGENAAEVWVDDDFTAASCGGHVWGYDAFDNIQDGVDAVAAGGIVNVADGSYTEQLYITKDNITIDGEDVATTIIHSPATLTGYFSTIKSVVAVDGATGFTINNLTIDGDGMGNSNYRFTGLAFWNAGGTVNNVDVLEIRDTPFSGAQHGVAVYAYNNTGGPYTIAIDGMNITDFQKNAMALSGEGLTVDLDNINVVGAGSTTTTAQNGIQIGFGASGTIDNATVTGIDYIDIVPPIPDWTATAVLLYDGGTVDLNNVSITNSQTNVYFIDTDGSFSNGSITSPVANYWADGIDVYASPAKGSKGKMRVPPSPMEEVYESAGTKGAVTVNVDNSTFTGIMHPDCYGISAYAEGTINMDIIGCSITYWDIGIVAYEDGGTVDVEAHECDLSNNNIGFWTNALAKAAQDATNNWWGAASGPYHPTLNPGGTGSEVSDNVLFDPWYTNPLMGEQIDIGLYNTTCGDFEIRLRPMQDINNTYLTNVQFAVKWPESTVNLINIASPVYGIQQQGPVVTTGGFNYAIFATATGVPINWTAGTEYLVMTFSHDESGTGYADFEIANDAWAQANNAVYYAELLGLDATGLIYQNALNVYLGSCDIDLKVYLQGPYNTGTGVMGTQVNMAGDLPLNQPYNVAPWNYSGTESVATFDPSVVDWALVELRTGPLASDMIERKAALLLDDGTVAQYDDITQGVRLDNVVAGNTYYLVIWHRNHFPVMTGDAEEWPYPLGTYDFTEVVITQPYGHPDAELELLAGSGVYGMIAGDVTANGELKYSGPGNDRGPIIALIVANTGSPLLNGVTYGYYNEDVNVNDEVKYTGTGNDRDAIIANITTLTGFPYLHYVFQTVVPGAYFGAKDYKTSGPVFAALRDAGDVAEIVIGSHETIKDGMVDNIQFTLKWKNGDLQAEKMVASAASGYGVAPQGPAITSDGWNYQVFVGVSPFFLPKLFGGSDEFSVMRMPKSNDFELGNRVQIAQDEFALVNNGMYYLSIWGNDYTGYVKSSPLGFNGPIAENGLNLYPNPVTGEEFTLEYSNTQNAPAAMQVLDVQGRIVLEMEIPTGDSQIKVNVNGLEKGVYLLKVNALRGTDVMRFVIN